MSKMSSISNKEILVAPSILAADFNCLGKELEDVVNAGADVIHFDVMDGHFVPNISYGVPVLKSIRKTTDKPFDVHLMISEPKRYAEAFAKAGADMIVFHIECDDDAQETIDAIKALGCDVGIALNPATPVADIAQYLDQLDMVLVMSVEPGFGGQSFMEDMLGKVRELRKLITESGKNTHIQIDGGIAKATAPLAIEAGVNVLVAGSSVFGHKEGYAAAVSEIRGS